MTAGRPCENCGGPLPDGSAADRVYCSDRCRGQAGDARRKARRQAKWPADRTPRVTPVGPDGGTCPGCGEPVEQIRTGTKAYCTGQCRQQHRNAERRAATQARQAAASRPCLDCGEPVTRRSPHGVPPLRCSRCLPAHDAERRAGCGPYDSDANGPRPAPSVERPCAWCGRPFQRPPGGRVWSKTCSPLCHQLRYNARKPAYQKLHPRPNRGRSDAERAKGRDRQRLNTARRKEREAVAGIEQLSAIAIRERVDDA